LAAVRNKYKLTHYFVAEGTPERFDLYGFNNDPEELENIYTPNKALAHTLVEIIKIKPIARLKLKHSR
jgi:hypothetical protein